MSRLADAANRRLARMLAPLAQPPPGRVMPPTEPPLADLVAESLDRAEKGASAARAALGRSTPVVGEWFELPATRGLRDPYGPDPVVFGSAPRVRITDDAGNGKTP